VLLFASLGLSMLIRLSLPAKSFRRTLLNHLIIKVVHDLFSFRRKVLANGPRLRQVPFGHFWIMCYYVCAETAIIVLPALILYNIKFSAPKFVHNLSLGRVLSTFWPILVRMCRNGHKTTSGVKFDLKFDFSVPYFLYGKIFWKMDNDFMQF